MCGSLQKVILLENILIPVKLEGHYSVCNYYTLSQYRQDATLMNIGRFYS
jgi:hypothetical protein